MSTYSPVVKELVRRILANNKYARFSGSAVDKSSYLAGGGPDHTYHLSFNEVPHDDGYTVHWWSDKTFLYGKKDDATGFDITYTDADEFHRMHHVLWKAIFNHDKRTRALTELAGSFDGKTVHAVDCAHPKSPYRSYGWDSSHTWHHHGGIRRRWSRSSRLVLPLAELWIPPKKGK